MKALSAAVLLLFFTPLRSQVANSLGIWVDHLPYEQAVDIAEANNLTYVACRQGLFVFDVVEKTLNRVSKVNGLSDVGLSALAWSETYQTLLIGYENGNLDLYRNGEVQNYPDLRLSSNYSGLKRINHIQVRGAQAFISTDFGILNFNIPQALVRETFIIGPQGDVLKVHQTTSSPDSLYAATDAGLYRAALNEPLFFFQNWSLDPTMARPINLLSYFDGQLFVNVSRPPNGDSLLFRGNGSWQFFSPNEVANNLDLRVSKGRLIVCNSFSARAYDEQFQLVKNWNGTTVNDSTFRPVGAAMGTNPENFYIADANNGLWHVFQIFPFREVPNGPLSENNFRLNAQGNRLYVAPGAYNDVGTPLFNNDGFYRLDEFEWQNYPSLSFGDFRDVVDIVEHPEIPGRLYVSIYGNGIVELEPDGPEQYRVVRIINESSTGGALPSISGNDDHRVADMDRDDAGNIWFSNALTDRPLGVIRPDGQVESFSLGAAGSGANVLEVMATSQGQVWLQVRNGGILVAQTNATGVQQSALLTASEGSGNLPSESVFAFAEDQDGEIWIGTNEGLAVLFSPENIFEPNRSYDASIIVIDEDGDGNGERVLGAQSITDIEVDGSNKKWFATANSGVFYTSENAREQLLRFERNNSPLPSNSITDIAINPESGMVYFATEEGMVSFQGQATEGVQRMTDVFAYPNPVTPDYEGPILIRGLVTNAQVKITDVEGNLVFETVAEGGQAIWNGRSFSGQRVASGVYLAFITDDLGSNTEVAKILIVN